MMKRRCANGHFPDRDQSLYGRWKWSMLVAEVSGITDPCVLSNNSFLSAPSHLSLFHLALISTCYGLLTPSSPSLYLTLLTHRSFVYFLFIYFSVRTVTTRQSTLIYLLRSAICPLHSLSLLLSLPAYLLSLPPSPLFHLAPYRSFIYVFTSVL